MSTRNGCIRHGTIFSISSCSTLFSSSFKSSSLSIAIMWQVMYAELSVISSYTVNCPYHGSPYEICLAN